LRISISAQLVDPTRVINMNVGDQRAIKSRHTVAQRLLTQVHPGVNDHAALRDTVKPLDKHRAAQSTIALIA
jgi:hypothetical protein